jgi:hypothetical protein
VLWQARAACGRRHQADGGIVRVSEGVRKLEERVGWRNWRSNSSGTRARAVRSVDERAVAGRGRRGEDFPLYFQNKDEDEKCGVDVGLRHDNPSKSENAALDSTFRSGGAPGSQSNAKYSPGGILRYGPG